MNQIITEAYLESLRQEEEPVKLKSLSKTQNKIYFFNTSRGSTINRTNSVNFSFDNKHFQNVSFIKIQKTGIFDILATSQWLHNIKQIDSPKVNGRLREAALYDDSRGICLTVWEDSIDLIEEGKTYKFYNLALKNFFGLKLSTTTSTNITATSDADKVIPDLCESELKEHLDHENMINDELHPKLCCPELFGTTVSVGPSCVNMTCGKALQIVPGSRIVIRINRSMTMRVDKCPRIFNCQLTFADLTLSLPVDVAPKCFKEDAAELFKKDETGFRMTLSLLENMDFTYNPKNIVTSMTDHPKNTSGV